MLHNKYEHTCANFTFLILDMHSDKISARIW